MVKVWLLTDQLQVLVFLLLSVGHSYSFISQQNLPSPSTCGGKNGSDPPPHPPFWALLKMHWWLASWKLQSPSFSGGRRLVYTPFPLLFFYCCNFERDHSSQLCCDYFSACFSSESDSPFSSSSSPEVALCGWQDVKVQEPLPPHTPICWFQQLLFFLWRGGGGGGVSRLLILWW